ncbi:MAG: 16S rRNA (guanine(527)-N(7))-methyltransferase RsmG [Huintestinicola sp.]
MTILEYEKISSLFSVCGLEIDKEQYSRLDKYAELLCEWNKVMNLTGITDAQGISEKHFLDSLLIFRYVDIPAGAQVIDVGTGAGFPGMAMKLYRPDISITLMDSLNKRINFLNEVAAQTNIKCDNVHMRAEEGGQNKKYREQYDFAAARAVAALPVLAEYCLPFVKKGGYFAAMKGPNEDLSQGENALKILGGKLEAVHEYTLPCGDKRVIAVIKKISDTPTKYPRNSGQISKKHL